MLAIWPEFSKRAPKATLVFLLCLCVLMIYFISGRQEMVYNVPDTLFHFKYRTNYKKTTEDEQLSNQTSWRRNNVTSSLTAYKYSPAKVLPKIDMMKLLERSQKKARIQIMSPNARSRVNYSRSQAERIERLKWTCNDSGLFRSYIYHGGYSTVYYYSSLYNFLYCKVPKSGSTFWTQVFNILEYGENLSEQVFAQRRSAIHKQATKQRYNVKFKSGIRKKAKTILVSRDPYSRLYSAFIDKSYLLLNFGTNVDIRKKNPKLDQRICPVNVTFQEFLDYILLKAKRGNTLNRHWAPIYNLCRPCDVNAYILVKQETFSKDIEEALQAVDVEKNKLDVIDSALKEHRVESTVPGIVETVYGNMQHQDQINTCIDEKGIALRLWKSFQIQGYIKKNLTFPRHEFKDRTQYSHMEYVTDVILQSIDKHKMTKSDMELQRRQALAEAYSEINKSTIEGIKALYKIDFEMFGYSTDPPSM